MNKKLLAVVFLIVICALFALSYYADNTDNSSGLNRTRLNVSGMNCYSVDEFVQAINTDEYYEGHDNSTAVWLLTLSGNVVFPSQDYYVVMSKSDAAKLPVEFATDVYITDIFDCEVMANKTLGGKFGNVLYVENVEFIRRDIESYDV